MENIKNYVILLGYGKMSFYYYFNVLNKEKMLLSIKGGERGRKEETERKKKRTERQKRRGIYFDQAKQM